ncbi:MAG: ribose-phosphate pyrophosphokinase [Gammaproteobacteria bacterium HGW-Gammaproteobacteria-9]|jgi:ribose-phosphate pyrophosphokinase|uniref:ribose-phosphate diphosphokinase n=1 Tax=Pseudomonas sp. (strain SCT) TaxID=412955 RepID=UPI000857520A|nr:ribose-phosphate diphosphokinase [Pseudomonas sp. SCT]OCX95284.1 MAG: ribose-phosphate pyrophosphokinase [Pseudomonas sp. CO183]PKM00492.1 MAG: ribose-phosphate pyrophosphokinase [Gammaproteobacteria bacterium HGW-Gammaproteobacteria-9]GCA55522.1 ribose-phosphate pyrophosphokinase 2 [Pseudomonas sp. SCT]
MSNHPPLLFALQGTQEYAARVARHMGLELAEIEERAFEDGEHKSRALTPVEGRKVAVFHALYGDDERSVNDKLCRLLFFCGALKDAGARHVQVVAPYLCYARKERRTQFQDPIITRYVAALFEACRVDRLTTLEVHNLAAFDNAFRIPTRHIESAELFAAHFAQLSADAELVAVSPDAGGAKRAESFRRALQQHTGRSVGSAYMEKYRSNDIVTGTMLVGDVRDRIAIIVDDLISTGGTLLRAGEACRTAGARQVHAAAAHGLFTGGPELLESPVFDQLVITDTVPPFRLDPDLAGRRLTVLDSSATLAAALAAEYR